MVALHSLIQEHKVIGQLIDALQEYVRRLRREDNADPTDLARFARAFREFADEIHHEKEEGILLPILARNGFHWDTGVLPEVRRDHRQERYLIEVLQHVAARAGSWTNDDRRSIIATALALIQFQREHMELENTRLFAEVPRRLPPESLARLEAELDDFDNYVRQCGRYVELDAVIAALLAHYTQDVEASRAAS
ncbi:MAG: hemerythrin domain-containing protein [Polyangiaceae bacterium]